MQSNLKLESSLYLKVQRQKSFDQLNQDSRVQDTVTVPRFFACSSWFGHITQHNGLTITILQGTLEGKTRGGHQKNLYGQPILLDTAQGRKKWRKTCVTASIFRMQLLTLCKAQRSLHKSWLGGIENLFLTLPLQWLNPGSSDLNSDSLTTELRPPTPSELT